MSLLHDLTKTSHLSFLFNNNERIPILRPHNLLTSWILHFILLFQLNMQLKAVFASEFNFGYETESYLSAAINLTYVDPGTGTLLKENLRMGKMLPGKTDTVSGVVVHVTSNNHTNHQACYKLDTDNLPKEPFIALVKYGNCRDQVKLRNVADAKAVAAVLYHDNHSNRVIKVERRAYHITFVVISQQKGEWLAGLVENGTRVMMRVGLSTLTALRLGQINRTSVLFVSISFIIVMTISFAWLVFYYIQRFRYIHAKEVLSRHLCSAAKKALDRIPIKTVKTEDNIYDEDELDGCAVCIESFQLGELIRTLPCNHSFHKICIDPWLLEQRSCPMCKLDILQHFGLIYTGSQESVLEMDEEDLRRPRTSFNDQEIVLVENERRHSAVRVAVPRDCANSTCGIPSLDADSAINEQSFITSGTLDVAVNTSDPPSEVDYESSEERWTSPFPKKGKSFDIVCTNEMSTSSNHDDVTNPEVENFEVYDVSFEK